MRRREGDMIRNLLLMIIMVVWLPSCMEGSKAVSKKTLRKLEAALTVDKIGLTHDQFEGISHITKHGGKMVLSFLSGKKERKAVCKLLKEYIPHIEIKKKTIEGSKCLRLKFQKVAGGEDDQEEAVEAGSTSAKKPSETGCNSEGNSNKVGEGGNAGDLDGKAQTGCDARAVAQGGEQEDHAGAKHVKYMKALLKKIRSTQDLEKRKAEGANLEAEQKAKLGRRLEIIKEITSAKDKAHMMEYSIPKELLDGLDEAVNAEPPLGKKPRMSSRTTLEKAHHEHHEAIADAKAKNVPLEMPYEPADLTVNPVDWGLGPPSTWLQTSDDPSRLLK